MIEHDLALARMERERLAFAVRALRAELRARLLEQERDYWRDRLESYRARINRLEKARRVRRKTAH